MDPATPSRLLSWQSNVQEPKRLDRFEVYFPATWDGISDEALRLSCHTVQLPSNSFSQTRIDRMHGRYFVAGAKANWSETVQFTFYDFVDNRIGTALDNWRKKIYHDDTKMGFPIEYKKDLTLNMYAPDGQIVETWSLVGCWPTEIARSSALSWKDSGDGIVEVTVTMSLDEAKLVFTNVAEPK